MSTPLSTRATIRQAARQHGWLVTLDVGQSMWITRNPQHAEMYLAFGARGGITYAYVSGRPLTGTGKRKQVLAYLRTPPAELAGRPLEARMVEVDGHRQVEITRTVPPTDDLRPEANPLVVGARVYVMDAGQPLDERPVMVLERITDHTAIVCWWDDNHHTGPRLVGQAYRFDRVTHNPVVATTDAYHLARAGWNIR